MLFGLQGGLSPLNAFSVPLLNTAVLLSSGATVTWAHHGIISGKRKEAIIALALTVALGFILQHYRQWSTTRPLSRYLTLYMGLLFL